MYLPRRHLDPTLGEVDLEVSHREGRLGRLAAAGRAAQRDAEPGEELAHREGLAHVVVGAGVERGDLVPLLPAGGEDDDRDAGPFPQPSDDVHAVEVGESEVQEDEVGLARRGLEEALLAGHGLDEPVPLGPERGAQEAANLRLVLD